MIALSLLPLAGLLVSSAHAAPQDTTVQGCTMFTVNGTWQESFQFYRYYDFRYANPSATRIGVSPWPKDRKNESEAQMFSRYTDGTWIDDWSIRTSNKAAASKTTIPLHYVEDNVFMEDINGFGLLGLNTSRLSNNTQVGGEIFWRPADVDAISLRVSARVSGDTGGVAGIFTYHNDTQESDIEILTRDVNDGSVHFTNQPTLDADGNPVADSTFNETMPNQLLTSNFNTYRLDWFPDLGVSAWYVDGTKLKASEVNVPFEASTVMIDMWSNGGSWSGDMPVFGEALLEIEWIEMVFNASTLERQGVPKKGVVCQIDPLGDNDGSQADTDGNGYTGPAGGAAAADSGEDSGDDASMIKASFGSSMVALAAALVSFLFL